MPLHGAAGDGEAQADAAGVRLSGAVVIGTEEGQEDFL
jgi:hypothetical protein